MHLYSAPLGVRLYQVAAHAPFIASFSSFVFGVVHCTVLATSRCNNGSHGGGGRDSDVEGKPEYGNNTLHHDDGDDDEEIEDNKNHHSHRTGNDDTQAAGSSGDSESDADDAENGDDYMPTDGADEY